MVFAVHFQPSEFGAQIKQIAPVCRAQADPGSRRDRACHRRRRGAHSLDCGTNYLAAPPPCLLAGSAVTVPPAILAHVPLGTRIQIFAWRSCLDVPAQALVAVPQSFLPAAATPAHFSMSAAAAV